MSTISSDASQHQWPVWHFEMHRFARDMLSIVVIAHLAFGHETNAAEPAADDPTPESELLEPLQSRTFDYFWETTNSDNGLVPDRWPKPGAPSSIAAVGFGLTAYGIGVERGWISRAEAIERVLTTLRFLRDAPQGVAPGASGHQGLFYHFLEMDSGHRYRNCELSSIDTALLMAGVLFCREYFDRDAATEQEIRELADRLYRQTRWSWMQPRPPWIAMGWKPEEGFGSSDYRGYNEAMLLYVLALGSPTFPIDPEAWKAYTSTYQWTEFYGQQHVNFDPLFGHQYSHIWIDFGGIKDAYMQEKGIDYFENSRRATYSQRAYAIDNPLGWQDYGANLWGLTACDGPADVTRQYSGEPRRFHSYWARGTSAHQTNDDGTLAPTAAGGSIPFAPEIALPALREMRSRYGDALFGKYGFRDSFNPSFRFEDVKLTHGRIINDVGWFDTDYLGIDQGPILLMSENYRTGFVWNVMRKSPYLRQGLKQAGFRGGWLDETK